MTGKKQATIKHREGEENVHVSREEYFTIIRENMEAIKIAGDQSLYDYDQLVEMLIEICNLQLQEMRTISEIRKGFREMIPKEEFNKIKTDLQGIMGDLQHEKAN